MSIKGKKKEMVDTNVGNVLRIGDVSDNGQVTIVDEDRLCYIVLSENNGAKGLRTISKALLVEFVEYFKSHPHDSSKDARAALSGGSELDKYEYGYNSTLTVMAKMVIQYEKTRKPIIPIQHTQSQHLQQIFYGAPGTGKSHKIKDNAKVKEADKKNLVFRTTFHPDSDYSTFVGAYKPTMKPVADKYKAVAGKDEEISYSFVPQAFLQAYIAAWNNPEDKVFLVIEEINRGNCAQIFGDLFQLLDRDSDGFSEYPIKADKDLAQYLSGKDENGQDILTNKDGIKDGKLCLPSNLYIWATMNTSDQSLFPIDSAFKRRWDWVYMPIDTAKEAWFVKVGDKYYSWTKFLNAINDEVLTDETAEDKHLGFYFCKATQKRNESDTEPSVITAETFVGKVLFYLWNDVFKVYGIPTSIGPGKDWGFRKFYKTDEGVNHEKVAELMAKLKIDAEPGHEQPNTDTQPE